MRRILQNAVALESEAQIQERLALETISMEEEQVQLDEAQADAVAADQELAEAERIIEVSDALEDLAVIADEITEASPTDIALVETAGQMAVAGSDIPAEEIVPAMEAYKGGKIATEGLRETAKNIWESILRFLKQVWEKIENFFYKVFGTIPALRRRLADLEAKVEDAVGRKAEGKIKLQAGITTLSVAYTAPKSEADISKILDVEAAAAKFVFGNYVDSVVKRGEVIAKGIESFDPANALESVKTLRESLKATKPDAIPGAGSADMGRFPGFATTLGTPLAGNVSLGCKYFVDNKADESDLGAIERYRNSRCELMPTSEKAKPATGDVEFAPISTSGAKAMIKDMEKLLDVLEEYKRGSKSKAIAKTQKTIEQASDKAAKAMAEADKGDEGQKAAVPYYRALLNFNAAYARWSQTPAVPMVSHSLSTIKAVMVVIQKSLAAYK
jgi:hypothetical protein